MKKVWIITKKESYDGPNSNAVVVAAISSKKTAETALTRLANQHGAEKTQISEPSAQFGAEQYDVATNATELKRMLK